MDFREFEVIVLYIDRKSNLNVINAIFKVTTDPELEEWIIWGLESYLLLKVLEKRLIDIAKIKISIIPYFLANSIWYFVLDKIWTAKYKK